MREVPINDEGSPEKDRIALLKLFDATGGNSTWDCMSGWGGATDIGTWQGVEASNGRVTRLRLESNELKGERVPTTPISCREYGPS